MTNVAGQQTADEKHSGPYL